MAASVSEVIAARFAASGGLQAALPGGLVAARKRTEVSATTVYAVFDDVSAVPGWSSEIGFYSEPTRIQFSVFAPSKAQAEAAARVLCTHDPDGFDRLAAVPLDDGEVVLADRVSGPIAILDESEGVAGARVWMATVDYLFHVSRSLA